MSSEHVQMTKNGRIIIPVSVRKKMGLKEGDTLRVEVDEHGLHIQTFRQALAQAQAILRKTIEPDRSLSAELIAERRLEAQREEQDH